MSIPDLASALIVDSVEDEYAHVRAQECACGGRFTVRGQTFAEDEAGRHFDVLEAACGDCDEERDFLFHVGPLQGSEPAGEASAAPVPADPPRRDPRIARGTLDLCALIAVAFSVAFLAFRFYASAAGAVFLGALFWFVPTRGGQPPSRAASN